MQLTNDEQRYFEEQRAFHEATYLAGTNPRAQSGFGRDEIDWRRFRSAIVAPITTPGSFLDIGCANGLLMESVMQWAAEAGHRIEPYGLEISEELAELARRRLPHWRDRIYTGNAFSWTPTFRFDYVRTELVYVPATRRREFVERLLKEFLAPNGLLLLCSYGSSRPEGARAEPLLDQLAQWQLPVSGVFDTKSEAHGFVITRVVSML
jgi:SAM-dependent methyltransferase